MADGVFIFVPAFQWLYGSFDKLVGHHRRYTPAQLENRSVEAGLRNHLRLPRLCRHVSLVVEVQIVEIGEDGDECREVL